MPAAEGGCSGSGQGKPTADGQHRITDCKKYLCLNSLQFLPILGHSFCRSTEIRNSMDMMVIAMMMMTIKMPINDDVVDNDELMSCPVVKKEKKEECNLCGRATGSLPRSPRAITRCYH